VADPAQTSSWERPSSAIDNEIGTYRAVSLWAIAAVLLGIVSLLCFANQTFLWVAGGAVVAGAIALRSIKRYPELVTGSRMANLGIGLGLVCGISSFTIGLVQGMVIRKEAQRFAEEYAKTLTESDFPTVFFLHLPPSQRKEITPEKFLANLQGENAMQFEADPRTQAIKGLKARLALSNEEHAHFVKIEGSGYEGVMPVAWAIIELDGPASEKEPHMRNALLILHASNVDGRRGWHVDQIRYPYESGSMAKTVESAHGHDH
jgi:hypothetical protein